MIARLKSPCLFQKGQVVLPSFRESVEVRDVLGLQWRRKGVRDGEGRVKPVDWKKGMHRCRSVAVGGHCGKY